MTPATLDVLCAGAVRHAFTTLVAAFERDSGHSIKSRFAAVGALVRQHAQGAAADFLLLNRPAMEALVAQGKVLAPLHDVGTVGVGLAVRCGEPRPDVSSPASLRAALLAASSLSYGDPAHGDSSGIHFARVIEQLQLSGAVADKTRLAPSGMAVAEWVRDGRVAIGATQASVIAACAGIELAGLLPAQLQQFTTYTCGCACDARSPQAAQQLLDYLRTSAARDVFASAGFATGPG
jgi:molybdate transport system substrate-binding protein